MDDSKAMMLEKRLRQFDQQASSSGQAPPALRVPSAAASDLPPAPKLPSASELPPLPPAASPKPASSPLKAPTGTLNFTLQRALGVTLKKAEAQGGVVYLAAAASELGEVDMALEAVGSVIYARLQASEGTGHPFSFLLHAFNRCEAEARSCRHADVGAALAECRQQLVQYSALLLTVPDFVPASASAGSAKVLADALLASNPTNGVRASYLSLVLAAVAESGDEAAVPDVLAPVVDRLLAQLKAPPGQPAVAAGDVSTRAVKALALLCSTKAAAAAVAARPDFQLPADQPGALLPGFNRTGPAVERLTLLGRCFTPHVATDAAASHFPDPFRFSQPQQTAAFNAIRAPVHALQQQQAALMLNLLKGGASAKAAALAWVCTALEVNAAATAERPDPYQVSSVGFRLNLAAGLLALAQPVCGDLAKEAKLSEHGGFLAGPSRGAYPAGLTPLVPSAEGAAAALKDEEPNFITQCFFLAARAVHLSVVQAHYSFGSFQQQVHHAYGRALRGNEDLGPLTPHFRALHVQDALVHDPVLLGACLSLAGGVARWLTRVPAAAVPPLPAHLLEDLCLVASCAAHAPLEVLQAANVKSRAGAPSPLASLFDCALRFLAAGPALAHAPHLRAKLGDLLYDVYLAPGAKPNRDQRDDPTASEATGPHHALLLAHPGAVEGLAPSLLDLYGAVEGLAAHDKNATRVRVSCLLKHLWSSEAHRRTFRRITEDVSTFVAFTNGLMNETNSHFLTVMEKLPEVRAVQTQMADAAAWAALPAAERESIAARLDENENWLRATLPICNETIHMIWYLSSDAEIRRPFLSSVLVGRLASMLLSVLVQLVIKGLQVKVNNPEEYSFTPKEMLAKIAQTVGHFASAPAFQTAVAHSAYYQQNPTVLRKAAATCRKHQLVPSAESDVLDAFLAAVDAAAADARAAEAQMAGAPEHFLDPLLSEVMLDPVTLPSGMVIDRATIETHLLNKPTDPFTNQPLAAGQLVPNHALKAEIEAWKASAGAATGMSDA